MFDRASTGVGKLRSTVWPVPSCPCSPCPQLEVIPESYKIKNDQSNEEKEGDDRLDWLATIPARNRVCAHPAATWITV